MAGTALVAATMLAGGALAADKKMMKPSISVNGYYDAIMGGVLDETHEMGGEDVAVDTSGLDVKTDTEVHFNGRATLDNGMKLHARWEFEGQEQGSRAVAGDWNDEYFLSVSGSFGKIILGGTGGAGVKMLTGMSGSWATGVGDTLNFDSDDWIGSVAGNFGTLQHARLDTGDGDKATYISPKFGGFQIGVSYVPTRSAENNGRIDAEKTGHDGFEGAASYSGKFGDVSFAVGGGMATQQGSNDGGEDNQEWLVAGKLSFGGGFTVAIAHKQTDDPMGARGQLTDAGVRFVTGPNQFSLVGSHGEMDDTDAFYTTAMGSYARVLGPGVKTHLNLIWNSSESHDGMTERSGISLNTALKVVF
ncbi:MAG: porin [Defluviicoccus sp.]|nr:porin [Defluviicoccus sp.]MDE0275688.1 porin [Defluviicoccus sp.]